MAILLFTPKKQCHVPRNNNAQLKTVILSMEEDGEEKKRVPRGWDEQCGPPEVRWFH